MRGQVGEVSRKGISGHHSAKRQEFYRDIDGFTQADKNKIVEWWPYAMTYYNNLLRRFPTTPDDVLFDGVEEALIYAIRTWDSTKKASFKTWFHNAVRMAVYRSWVQYKNSYLCNYSRDTPLPRDLHLDDYCFKDVMSNGYVEWEDQCVDRLTLDEVMSCLNPKEQEIMKRVYVYNEKQSDIARAMGVTRQRVSFVHGEAIRKCREAAKEG